MMKKFLFFVAGCMTLCSACEGPFDDKKSHLTGESVVITAGFPEDDDSKVSMSETTEGLSLSWQQTDRLKVIGQTTETFLLTEIDGKKARFIGNAVAGSSFDIILSDSENYLERSYIGQVQEGVSSTAHLVYDAALIGVDSYTSVKFTSEWAAANGGELYQSGCVLLHFQLPVSAQTVTKVTLKAPEPIFYSTNSASSAKCSAISLTIADGVVGSDNQVKAYIMTSMQKSVISADMQLSLIVETDKGTYIKSFTPGYMEILPGKRNVIKLNSKNWSPLKEYKEVSLMTYNVGWFHKGYSTLGDYSYPEVASVIQQYGADIVGLNETDKDASRSEYVFQAEELTDELGSGWSSCFAYAGYTWYGNSIVASASYPIVKQWPRLELAQLDGSEVRSMGVVEYEDVVFCSAHLDHSSLAARLNAVNTINDWVAENYSDSEKIIIFAGDMNCTPDEATITGLQTKWDWVSPNEYSYPSSAPTKCIDYIFVWKGKAHYEVLSSEVITSCTGVDLTLASDHLPICVKIGYVKEYLENDVDYGQSQGVFDSLPDNDIFNEL